MKIYIIKNTITNKCYIGQTCGSIKERWTNHREAAKYDKTKNSYIYNAMRKYGVDNFYIEEIDTAASIQELNEKEVKYIQQYNTLYPNGYNIQSGGNNRRLELHEILKLSKPLKATNTLTDETFYFCSLTEPNSLGFSRGAVSLAISENRPCKGYNWQHISIEEWSQNKHKTAIYQIPKIYSKNIKTGEIKYYSHIADTKLDGFNPTKVTCCLRKYYRYKTHKGHMFFYVTKENSPTNPADMAPQS